MSFTAANATIRQATIADLGAINDIYNHNVLHSTCTFQTEPETLEDRQEWFEGHGPKHPILVAEHAGRVIGWASLSPYKTRCAYRMTVEDSIYLHHEFHGRGLGTRLLGEIIGRGRGFGHHSMIAIIAADQPASIRLHERQGFVKVSHLKEVGWKFDRWIDTIFMQKMLA